MLLAAHVVCCKSPGSKFRGRQGRDREGQSRCRGQVLRRAAHRPVVRRSSPFWCLVQGPSPDLCRACRFSKCQGVRLTLCLARGRKGPVPLPERGCLQMAIPTPELPVGRTGAPLKTTSCSRFPPPVSSPSLLPVLISDPR